MPFGPALPNGVRTPSTKTTSLTVRGTMALLQGAGSALLRHACAERALTAMLLVSNQTAQSPRRERRTSHRPTPRNRPRSHGGTLAPAVTRPEPAADAGRSRLPRLRAVRASGSPRILARSRRPWSASRALTERTGRLFGQGGPDHAADTGRVPEPADLPSPRVHPG